MKSLLDIKNLHFRYQAQSPWIFKNLNLSLSPGENLTILGPSGCGKSTLLALIAGLQKPVEGKLHHDKREIIGPSSKRVMIFQGHVLFPWKSALENVEFALLHKKMKAPERKKLALEYLEQVGLGDYHHFYPKTLSGGMQQRVGIARALAADPDMLLLDEPFSSLDLTTKEKLIADIKKLSREKNKTLILVTHQLEEACLIGGKVILMGKNEGEVLAQWRLEGGEFAFQDFLRLKEELRCYYKDSSNI